MLESEAAVDLVVEVDVGSRNSMSFGPRPMIGQKAGTP